VTPAEERRFIRLWQQEANYREIAEELGCALGTVASRAAALVAQGNIQPRPRGGAYPRQKAPARPVQTPVQITALPSYPKGKAVRWNLWILDAIKEDSAPAPPTGTCRRASWCRSTYGKP
jgi:DNA-binding transcriptional MocR family regulator